ncbi:ribonuclease III [Nitrospirota bacterium]
MIQSTELRDIQSRLGYSFRDESIFLEALTHKSFHYEHPEDSQGHNERLEFLGDSILGVIVAEYLFKREERMTEAMMSKVKSYVVKGTVLAVVADALELGNCMRLGRGEEDTGGREKPTLLANIMEAVIGAVYIDGGMDVARGFVLQLLEDRLDESVVTGDFRDYKTVLQEATQERWAEIPEYRLVKEDGLDHQRTYTVEVHINKELFGTGSGTSKKQAQKAAAKAALNKLESNTDDK